MAQSQGFGTSVGKAAIDSNTKSQISQDFNSLKSENRTSIQGNQNPDNGNSKKSGYAAKLQDYEFSPTQNMNCETVALTEDDVRARHPLDYIVHERRRRRDVYRLLHEHNILLVNLPDQGLNTKDQIIELIESYNKLRKPVIIDVKLYKGCTSGQEDKVIYILIEFSNPSEAKVVKGQLNGLWFKDKKLKVKSKADLLAEDFNNRTVLIQNLPSDMTQEQLLQLFSPSGNIVGVEMPTYDYEVEKELANRKDVKLDSFTQEHKDKTERQYLKAQRIAYSSANRENDFQDFLNEYLGVRDSQIVMQEARNIGHSLSKQDVLNHQKVKSTMKAIASLRQESKLVVNAKQVFAELRSEMHSKQPPSLQPDQAHMIFEQNIREGNISNQVSSQSNLRTRLTQDKQDLVKGALSYLLKNRDKLDEPVQKDLNALVLPQVLVDIQNQQDALEALSELSQKQLSLAYDELIEGLDQREVLIQTRLHNSLKHLGVDERVLYEKVEGDKVFEHLTDYTDALRTALPIEDFLSIEEQIQGVEFSKNMSPEMKIRLLAKRSFPTDYQPANFNKDMINNAKNPRLHEFKDMPIPEPQLPQSEIRNLYNDQELKEDVQANLDAHLKQLKDQFDIPYDELYHKEKQLVQGVILAQQELKLKQARLPMPIGSEQLFQVDQIETSIDYLEISDEHQFTKDKRTQAGFSETKDVELKFDQQLSRSTSRAQQMVQEGLLSEQDYEMLKSIQRQHQEVNCGYALVTYSHSDEARKQLLFLENIFVGKEPVQATLKTKDVEHEQLDRRYYLNRMKNDSKIVDQIQQLRAAKEELRIFEKNIDSQLPNAKKLKEFRKQARDLIENKEFSSREDKHLGLRTLADEAKLDEKIRQLQKENPHIDYSQLFETDRGDSARKSLHKKAFASYKAFEFIKHGVEFRKQQQTKDVPRSEDQLAHSKSKVENSSLDPYNFPLINDTVAQFITKDRFPRFLDEGDSSNKPGRKFGYTEQDFLEAYLGKDYARMPNIDTEDNRIFSFSESLKKKYPIDKYLRVPTLEKIKQDLNERIDISNNPTSIKDKQWANYLANFDIEASMAMKDTPHPTDPKRSYIMDTGKIVDNLVKTRYQGKDKDIEDSIKVRDLRYAKYRVKKEYLPPPVEASSGDKRIKEETDNGRTNKFEPTFETEEDANQESSSAPASHSDPESKSIADRKLMDQSFASKNDNDRERRPRQEQTLRKPNFNERGLKSKVDGEMIGQGDTGRVDTEVELSNLGLINQLQHSKEENPVAFKKVSQENRLMRTYSDIAKANDVETDKFLSGISQKQMIGNANHYGGDFLDKANYDDTQQKMKQQLSQRVRGGPRTLDQFVSKQKSVKNEAAGAQTDSDKEDEDIYGQYLRRMRESTQSQALDEKQRMEQRVEQHIDTGLVTESPRFQDHFQSESRGKHLLEDDQYSFNDEEAEVLRKEEEEYDKELFERELRGRLMGEKLTPRQFEMLYQTEENQRSKLSHIKNSQREQFVGNREIIKVAEEQIESYRRRQVLSGIWSEEESQLKMKQKINDLVKEIDPTTDKARQKRELMNQMDVVSKLASPEKLMEKEYYFDEGLGQTLQEHVQEVKSQFEGLEVFWRRDREGFAIVKTRFKPQYKYNLDEVLNYNDAAEKIHLKETLETLYNSLMPGNQPIDMLDKSSLHKTLLLLQHRVGGTKEVYDLDMKSKHALNQLLKERQNGIFRKNKEGFQKAFLELSERVTYDKSKKLSQTRAQLLFGLGSVSDISTLMSKGREQALQDLSDDRQLISAEIAQQLQDRIKEHKYLKERKPTDFVRARRSEEKLFNHQLNWYSQGINETTQKLQDLEANQNKTIVNKDQQFDKAAFKQLKDELARRTNAKTKLLEQNFPDLKSYVEV